MTILEHPQAVVQQAAFLLIMILHLVILTRPPVHKESPLENATVLKILMNRMQIKKRDQNLAKVT